MSFIQSVTGPSFQTGFTFTTNNISVDDISCNTLEANTAVIQDLTTVNFQPIILNTSTLSASAAYIDDIFCQNISSTGIIDAFEINVCNIDIQNVSVEKASMTEADVSLLVIKDQTNTKQSEIERDNDILTIAGGYVDGTNQYTGDIDLTPYHQGNSSVVSLKVRASDGGVIIPNLESTNITMTTLNSNVINVSYLYVDEVTTYKNAGNAKATILATSNSLQFSSGSSVAQIFSAGVDEYININPTTNKTTILNAELDGDTIIEGLVNLSISNELTCGGNLSVGLQYTQEIIFMSANMATQNSQFISANTQDTYNLLTQDYSIQGNPGIKYLFCDHTLGNTNISNLSVDNLSVNNIVFDNLSFDNLSVTDSFTCNDAQIDDLFNCDMTNTLRGGTSGLDIPFDNISVNFDTGTKDTLVMLKPNIVLYNISLLSDILTLAPPTFEMTTGTAQITNANMSNLSVNNLSVITDITTPSATITNLTVPAGGIFNHDFSQNISAGTGISITQVGNKAVITNTGGSVTDPLNLSKLNVSNISCDEGITTDTLTCDLTPNLTAGAGVSITSVANKPVISAVNSVSANVPVSDFIETLQIIPSGTRPFLSQGIDQMSFDINVHDYQGGTAYSPSNMVTVNAGDKIVFNWKQSGWKQTNPAQLSFICYLVSGVGASTSANRIPVGRIYQYVYPQSDHEEISGSFVYYVTSGFSFYRSQIEGTGGVVTQGQDYGAATATVYRATVPNSITVPTLIDATNISVDNLSVTGDLTIGGLLDHDLTPNLTAGANITITSVGGKPVISSSGGGVTDPLNISRLNASDVHAEALNVSGSAAFLSDGLTVFGSTTTQNISTNHISSAGFITAVGDIKAGGGFITTGGSGITSTGAIRFNNQANGLGDSLEIYYTGTQFGMGTVSGKDFTINAGINTGGLVVSGSLNNINMSNCSITNLSLDTLTCDLTSNLTAGTGITITSVGGKPTITALGGGVADPLNLSQLNASNISVDVDVTITGNMRYTPDAARARRATGNGNQAAPGAVSTAIVEFPTVNLTTPTITKLGLSQFRCNSAGNYRIICSLNLINTSSTNVNRRSVRYRILINGAFAEADYGMFSSSVYFRGQGQMTEGCCVGSTVMPLLALDTISIQYETQGGGNLENILVRANSYIYIEFMG